MCIRDRVSTADTQPTMSAAADVCMKVNSAANVQKLDKDAMEVMEIDTEVEFEYPAMQFCQSIDFGTL